MKKRSHGAEICALIRAEIKANKLTDTLKGVSTFRVNFEQYRGGLTVNIYYHGFMDDLELKNLDHYFKRYQQNYFFDRDPAFSAMMRHLPKATFVFLKKEH